MPKKDGDDLTNGASVRSASTGFPMLSELSEEDQRQLRGAAQVWHHMAKGQHLNDWLALGRALLKLRAVAMQRAEAKQPKGSSYNKKFGDLTQEFFPAVDSASVTALLWLQEGDRLDVLERAREKMTPGERARLNSPITARQLVRREMEEAQRRKAKPRESKRPAKVIPLRKSERKPVVMRDLGKMSEFGEGAGIDADGEYRHVRRPDVEGRREELKGQRFGELVTAMGDFVKKVPADVDVEHAQKWLTHDPKSTRYRQEKLKKVTAAFVPLAERMLKLLEHVNASTHVAGPAPDAG